MGRAILHIDMNSCYASIECLHHPEIRHLPVAVGGAGIRYTVRIQNRETYLFLEENRWFVERRMP